MRFFFAVLLMIWGVQVRADVLPPDVRDLAVKVEAAERGVAAVRAEMASTQRTYAVMDTRLRRATATLVRTQQFPPGFWLARAVVSGEPGAADTAAMAVRQSVRDVAAVDARVKGLRQLYEDSNSKLEALREARETYRNARGRMSSEQQQALHSAMVEADTLAQTLAAVVPVSVSVPALENEEISVTAPVVAKVESGPVKAPVEGSVVQGFHGGKGATAEGVVMKAKKGAEVRSVVAGEVLYSGPFRQFGGLVIVKGEGGEDVLFGGLGMLRVSTGHHVLAGDVVGNMGDEGRLYWEVRRRGRTVNPLAMLRGGSLTKR